jgi:transcriptional regulator with XRE-family HTH domain
VKGGVQMNNNDYASKQLKKLRTRKNLTQGELAEELGVTQQQIARYENGKRNFKQDFLIKLSEYFNVPISNFFDNEREPIEENTFIPVYDGLNFKKTNEYIELPKSWFKNKNNVYCIKLEGDIASYKKGENQYIVFEKK